MLIDPKYILEDELYVALGKENSIQHVIVLILTSRELTQIMTLFRTQWQFVEKNQVHTLKLVKVSSLSHWEVQCHSLSFIIYICKHYGEILIKGSLNTAFAFKGIYNNGIVCVKRSDFIFFRLDSVFHDKLHDDSILIVPLNESPVYKVGSLIAKVDSTNEYSTIVLKFNKREISAIIGENGNTIQSIRFQSRCFIKILPVNNYNTSQGNLCFQTMQDVIVSGLNNNVNIAIGEIKRIIEKRSS